jgi:hypothetical protein
MCKAWNSTRKADCAAPHSRYVYISPRNCTPAQAENGSFEWACRIPRFQKKQRITMLPGQFAWHSHLGMMLDEAMILCVITV